MEWATAFEKAFGTDCSGSTLEMVVLLLDIETISDFQSLNQSSFYPHLVQKFCDVMTSGSLNGTSRFVATYIEKAEIE